MNLLSIAAPFAAAACCPRRRAKPPRAAAWRSTSSGSWSRPANFILFAVILYLAFGKQVSGMLAARRERIEQGIRDAEQARRDRESAETERLAALTEARREANEILARAQKVAQETRDADIAATREELERMRVRATEEIDRGEAARARPSSGARSRTWPSRPRAASSARP